MKSNNINSGRAIYKHGGRLLNSPKVFISSSLTMVFFVMSLNVERVIKNFKDTIHQVINNSKRNFFENGRTVRRSDLSFKYPAYTAVLAVAICVGLPSQVKSQEPIQQMQEVAGTDIGWWRDSKFGMFIHWGLYAIPAGEWEGIKYPNTSEWILADVMSTKESNDQSFHDDTVDKYNQFVSQFNPTNFDADKWVLAAKNAGMKYIVVTAKHHDGFCMWDTAQTDYDIVDRLGRNAPYKRDVLAELKAAADRHGMKFGVYYSILDWHHEAFELNTDWNNLKNAIVFKKFKPGRKAEYISYMKAQLREIYDKFDPSVIWLDGQWVTGWSLQDGQELFDFIKTELNSNIVINDRAAPGKFFGESLEDKISTLFDRTLNNPYDYINFEQSSDALLIDSFLEEFPKKDWEFIMTLNNNWGFNAADTNWKSVETLLTDNEVGLINLSYKGGNLLLNVGPDALGNIPQASLDRLAEIGDWFSVNGEAIYGTTKVPDRLKKPDWGWFTYKTGFVFAHVVNWPQTSQLEVELPGFGPFRGAYLLEKSGVMPLKTEHTTSGYLVDLPSSPSNPVSSVIVFDFSVSTPALIQSSFGNQGDFEELVVHENGQLCHYWRDNDDEPNYPWHKSVCFGENITSDPALIQSNFGNQGNFELVVNESGQLCHYWRDNDDETDFPWHKTVCFGENITSAPALIQSTFGDQGNFELVVNEGEQLCHYWRDNDDEPSFPWRKSDCFGDNVTSDPDLIQSNFGDQGNFELVVNEGEQLCHYWRDNDDEPSFPWRKSDCFGDNITSDPAFIQSNFGDRGNFELLVNEGGQLCHFWRDNDNEPDFPWSKTVCFGENIISDPDLIQSNFGDQGNFELVAQKDDQVCHWWRRNDDPALPWLPGKCFGINLVAHWPLNEGNGTTVGDITGNGHDGVLTNDPVWNGNNLIFDGINDYVNVGLIDVSGESLTLAGWAQSENLENCGSRDCRILSKATGTASQDHYWMLSTIKVGDKTRLRFRLKTNGSTSTLIASSGDLKNGVPFHAAAVYDGDTMRLYKDGVEVGSLAKTGTIDANNAVETWIGGNPNDSASRPWKGSIAEVRVYQKALTVEEVKTIKDLIQEPGIIVVNNDEWTLSFRGFARTPADATYFALNLADSFAGGMSGDFLVYSTSFVASDGLIGFDLKSTMESAGHNWTIVDTTTEFSLSDLLEYDGIFLAGIGGNLGGISVTPPDAKVLIDYVKAGGNIYLSGGTDPFNPQGEAAQWNPLLNACGLDFASVNNSIEGVIPIVSNDSLFDGVQRLYQNNGNSISKTDSLSQRAEILASFEGEGLYGLCTFD